MLSYEAEKAWRAWADKTTDVVRQPDDMSEFERAAWENVANVMQEYWCDYYTPVSE